MTRRVVVQLCRTHRSVEFLQRDDGWEFTDRLEAVWRACGLTSADRLAALTSHRRTYGPRPDRAHCPGSYSWPELRREAERRFGANESPDAVIADLRTRRDGDRATLPSVQTMRRWFREGRWLDRQARGADGAGCATRADATQARDDADVDRPGPHWYTRTGRPPHPMRHVAPIGMRMEIFPPFDAHIFDMSRMGPAEDDFGDRWIHGP